LLANTTRLLALFLALSCHALSQPPPPTPAKTSETRKQNGNAKSAQTDGRGDIPPGAANTPAAGVKGADTTKEEREPAPLDWNFWLTVVIASASVAQAMIYYFQTRLMRSSLEVTREAAAVTAQMVIASIEAQRPHVYVQANGNPIATISEPDSPRVVLNINNLGATPAYGVTYEKWIEVIRAPFTDFSGNAFHIRATSPVVLLPSKPLTVNIPIRPMPTPERMRQLQKFESHVCIRMKISYRDSLRSCRCVEFGYRVELNGLGYLPKYNHEAVDLPAADGSLSSR
jgi:hypothetical protein